MIDYSALLQLDPYSLDSAKKSEYFSEYLFELTNYHRDNCLEYRNILSAIDYSNNSITDYSQLPFLPVSLFKLLELKSIENSEVFKTMTSSGTSGQAVSKIFLDRITAANQQKTLVKIVSSFLGSSRLPMLIIDSPAVLKDRSMFSARGAGILGFSLFGTEKLYALDEDMKLDLAAVQEFMDRHKGEKILIFGFTFMVWQHLYKELIKMNQHLDLSNGILIHGGGWKKLISESVTSREFKLNLNEVCGLSDIHDYYGMVEQTGCIYMECEEGYLHASIFSDVIVRRPDDFSICEIGETGIVQVVSLLPESYPGHSLLTEDEGVICGVDTCSCGRKGKYFKVLGRIANAEIRGCSDTYASKFI